MGSGLDSFVIVYVTAATHMGWLSIRVPARIFERWLGPAAVDCFFGQWLASMLRLLFR